MTDTTPTDTASPSGAPASESTPTNTAPEASTASADVYSGSSSTEAVQSSPEASTSQPEGIINQLYTSEGGLAENYTDLLRENGMENLTNTIQKYKSADGLLKGAANLVTFAGRKIEGVVVGVC